MPTVFTRSLYSFGARSFSVWNGSTGALLFDSKNELDVKAKEAGIYDDGRSDDKSVEPEGIALGTVGGKTIVFVGLERVDAVALYDVTNPTAPVFLKLLKCGDAPEGVLFVDAKNSPNKKEPADREQRRRWCGEDLCTEKINDPYIY